MFEITLYGCSDDTKMPDDPRRFIPFKPFIHIQFGCFILNFL